MVDHIGWRWVFWLNLPLAGVALGLVFIFVNVSSRKHDGSVWKQLLHIDNFGNLFLMGAVTSILLALASSHPWSSWHSLLPLIIGLSALPIFILFESSPFCLLPTMPLRLLSNKDSTLAFLLTFLHGILLYWTSYFLPIYSKPSSSAPPKNPASIASPQPPPRSPSASSAVS